MSTLFLDPVDGWEGQFPPLPSTTYEALRETAASDRFRLGGPVVHRGGDLFFPIPADLRRERGGALRRLVPMRPIEGLDLRGPIPGHSAIPMEAAGAKGPVDRPEGFVTTRGLTSWLRGGAPDADDVVSVEELNAAGRLAPGVGFAAWADELGGLASGIVVAPSIAVEVAKDGPAFPPPPRRCPPGISFACQLARCGRSRLFRPFPLQGQPGIP